MGAGCGVLVCQGKQRTARKGVGREKVGDVGKTWESELQQERGDQREPCTQKLSVSSERPQGPG